MKTVFLRVLEAGYKAAALSEALRDPDSAKTQRRFELDAPLITIGMRRDGFSRAKRAA